MSDHDRSGQDPSAGDAEKPVAAGGSGDDSVRLDVNEITRYLQWGLLALFVLFALVAAVSLYENVGRIIRVWVAEDYRPIFNAAFNLLVLLIAAAGIGMVLRWLRR